MMKWLKSSHWAAAVLATALVTGCMQSENSVTGSEQGNVENFDNAALFSNEETRGDRCGQLYQKLQELDPADTDYARLNRTYMAYCNEGSNEEERRESSSRSEPANERVESDTPTREEPTREEPTREEPTREEPSEDNTAPEVREEPSREEPSSREPTREEPTREEPSEETSEPVVTDEPTRESAAESDRLLKYCRYLREKAASIGKDSPHYADAVEKARTVCAEATR